VLGYLPQVIVAVLILLVAAVVAEAAEQVVVGSAKAAALKSAGFLGKVARYAIWIFALLAALAQLNVATLFVQTLFTGVVIAVSLAVGLAFGLGGQQAAARYLEHLQQDFRE
jgi:small-conductance mechanosensitive channel